MDRSAKRGGRIEAVQTLALDLGDYLDLRYQTFRAQLGGLIGTVGGAFGFAMAALISLGVGYLLALGVVVALLARLFSGEFLWPLLLMGLAHLLVAAAIAFFALRGEDVLPDPVLEPSSSSSHPIESTSTWTTPEISAN